MAHIRSLDDLTVRFDRLKVGTSPVDSHHDEVLRTGYFLDDIGWWGIDVIKRRATAPGDHVVHTVLKIVLIIVIVAEESG